MDILVSDGAKSILRQLNYYLIGAHRIPGDFFVEPSVNQAGHKVGQKMRNLSRCSYTVLYSLGAQPLVQRLVLVRR